MSREYDRPPSALPLCVCTALSLLALALWPLKRLIRLARRRQLHPQVRRVVVIGLDGQDPQLTRQFMDEGLLPNFCRLREQGSFRTLATTLPAESPVAWSSTPGKPCAMNSPRAAV